MNIFYSIMIRQKTRTQMEKTIKWKCKEKETKKKKESKRTNQKQIIIILTRYCMYEVISLCLLLNFCITNLLILFLAGFVLFPIPSRLILTRFHAIRIQFIFFRFSLGFYYSLLFIFNLFVLFLTHHNKTLIIAFHLLKFFLGLFEFFFKVLVLLSKTR